ncbi:ribosome recycling factor family protein [Vibrio sp. YIC-376]|uniref:ribosome recycling factor family protein n=1 Tax=Vibrio sp. YIC-376 TaxID=3136162 RepID=UPI00402AAC76
MNSNKLAISLPSLVHRIGGEHVKRAKVVAMEIGCELKRVRRSRNWLVTGDALDLKKFLDHIKAEEPEILNFVIKKMEAGLAAHQDKLEPLEAKLIRLVLANPNVTLAELMSETNCTIAQARTARFEAEML